MTGWLQAAASIVLALGLHVGLFAFPSGPIDRTAEDASGEVGKDTVSLAAQDQAISTMVAQWDRPPVVPAVSAETPVLTDPSVTPIQSAAPQTLVPPNLPEMPQLVAPDERTDARPSTMPPPDLPQIAPKPKADPVPEEKAPKTPKKKVTPPAADSRAGQKAAGSGGGVAEGTDGKAENSGVSNAKAAEMEAAWGAKIVARIERKKAYPKAAKGASGKVSVRLVVGRGGDLQGVSVTGSSGNAALDGAAIKAVKAAGKFPKAPKGLTKASYSFSLTLKFKT